MTVKVGSIRNQRPRFVFPEDGVYSYEASVREDAPAGTEVARVAAEDPDGPRNGIRSGKNTFLLKMLSPNL